MSNTLDVNESVNSKEVKKNGLTNASDTSVLDENYEFPNKFCYICNGYYGPCFGEPICTTCHAFLFPENLTCAHLELDTLFTDSTDDSDSGNDEPTDSFNNVLDRRDKLFRRSQRCLSKKTRSLQKVDLLAQQIMYLTTPRNSDDVSPGIVQCLPPEVLFAVFSYLDDLSLYRVGKVCKRWRNLLKTQISDDTWKEYTLKRWPLFKPIVATGNWFKLYTRLVESSPCQTCLQIMGNQTQTKVEEYSWRKNRLRYELRSLQTDPLEGIQITPLDFACFHWQATITGPVGSPFEGGLFYLHIQVPHGYPLCPPVVRFLTKIFHPNVSRHGDVGIDSLQHNWSLALTISKVLISVQSLLTDPYCHVCMEPDIGSLYLSDRSTYENIARAWTWKYAMHDILK
ncbi:hypothetical protein RUM44_003009 [Polyplax serrata]|uniref:Uncharacterized protein n=1 Tax=Polyplax serrata TaxID=468196 RepID=A0ABR1AXA7_POLSC